MSPALTPEQRLHLCIQDNDAGQVRTLLQDNVDVNWKNPQNHNNTALHVAVEFEKGNLAIIRMLLQHPLIKINEVNIFGSAPLHRACHFGKDALIVELLARPASNHARPNLHVSNNPTPLFKAASAGHVACVKKLIALSPEHLDTQSKCVWDSDHPRTADDAALVNKQTEVSKVLVAYSKDRDEYKDALVAELGEGKILVHHL